MRSTDGTFLMDNEHLCGGMVKDMCLEEHNCSSFLRFVGDAHDAENYKNCGVCVAAVRAMYLA